LGWLAQAAIEIAAMMETADPAIRRWTGFIVMFSKDYG
jgi:hypothetical protein